MMNTANNRKQTALPRRERMFAALLQRDPAYEGVFFACVRTTGIFCRPTCRARKPRPENVEFVAAAREAMLAGYRPCRVCHPLDAESDNETRRAVELLSTFAGRPVRDADLRAHGLSPERVRRNFQKEFGMTFQAYQRAGRIGAALEALRAGAPISSTALQAGYESESGFRDAFGRVVGAPPGRGRATRMLYAARIETPLGAMLAAADDQGLLLLEFLDRKALASEIVEVGRRFGGVVDPRENAHITRVRTELDEYFAGRLQTFQTPLRPEGTDFQRQVWAELLKIPFGETVSYQHVARGVGRPNAMRAVGLANGRNRIAIVIPCHRVIGANGKLVGYGGGLWRKKRLLELEGAENSDR